MIKINKDFNNIPDELKKLESYFIKNNDEKNFVDTNSKYAVIKDKLKEIYNKKCGYCEKDLSDSFSHIEHYRPKNKYYWLSYSWDNLLLSCEVCNIKKNNTFELYGEEVIYSDEKFEDIHNLGEQYDKQEKPKNINPEKEDILDKIIFDTNGVMCSLDKRVLYTIKEACFLNREELVGCRVKIINDFRNALNECLNIFIAKKDIDIFEPTIKTFKKQCNKENNFYAFRKFILNNPDIFFENKQLAIIKRSFY